MKNFIRFMQEFPVLIFFFFVKTRFEYIEYVLLEAFAQNSYYVLYRFTKIS